MPRRQDLEKILVIGSGPIVIGQAAEFDYSGTQACIALKEEGYKVILANSNPATIMTDTHMADKVYMEPLNLEFIAKIIRKERPNAIVSNLGGQTGLNLSLQLHKKGILEECQVEVIGTALDAIERAEDRELFKELCEKIGEPVVASAIAHSVEEAKQEAKKIGYPVVLRPAFTLGGTGGGFADDEAELEEIAKNAVSLSPTNQVLIESSIKGLKEIEFEVMRDKADNAISICCMENVDPVGVHTGDSIVVCPQQTITDKEYNMLRDSSLNIIRELSIEGGCNVQFALNSETGEYFVIEVNPRVSRSSALASKASGYPIARVSAKIAVGYTLDEIKIANTTAINEPSLDYVICKLARFPFDKFDTASRVLSTQMKATGEVMALGRTLEESILKAVRGIEQGVSHIHLKKLDDVSNEELLEKIAIPTDERIYELAELCRRGVPSDKIFEVTRITKFFIDSIYKIIAMEVRIRASKNDLEILREAKKMGFSDEFIGQLWDMDELEMFRLRKQHNIFPVYQKIDAVTQGKFTDIPYYYSTYDMENELEKSKKPSVVVLGSGPIRIGQGVEFDYCTVHAIWAIREAGYEAIIINNNPETVSTDYTTSDKLFFEPVTVEDVMNVVESEKPVGVIVTLGGQTAINVAERLEILGVPIMGTGVEAIRRAENRREFEELIRTLGIPQPEGKAVTTIEEGREIADKVGYPVLVRPSYVLGGRAMRIVPDDEALCTYLKNANNISYEQPILVDKYIFGKEVEVDAICDGKDVLIPGIMELVERTGIHSGDSMSVYPTFSISEAAKAKIEEYTRKLGLAIGIKGPYNIQFIVDPKDDVYIIEVNPRSSRTVPFLSKATGVGIADIAARVSLGIDLEKQGYKSGVLPSKDRWYVKVPVFSFSKIRGLDAMLSPEMKSTGEAIGYDKSLNHAMYKALQAANLKVQNYGTVFVTIADEDKEQALPLIKRFYEIGFNIEATKGTAEFLKANGIRTRVKKKISEGSNEIIEALSKGYVAYVVNTLSLSSSKNTKDGFLIRRHAVENNVTTFTSLDSVKVLLDVLEEITIGISTIDA